MATTRPDGTIELQGGSSRRGKPRGPPGYRSLATALKAKGQGYNKSAATAGSAASAAAAAAAANSAAGNNSINPAEWSEDETLFVDFISRCLDWDPETRMTPDEALRHGWLRRRLPRTPAKSTAVESPARQAPWRTSSSGSVGSGTNSLGGGATTANGCISDRSSGGTGDLMILGDATCNTTTASNGTSVLSIQSTSSVGTSTSAAAAAAAAAAVNQQQQQQQQQQMQQNGNGGWPPVTTRVFMRTRRAAMNEALALASQGAAATGSGSGSSSSSSVGNNGMNSGGNNSGTVTKLPHSGSTGSLAASTLTGPAAAAGQRRYSTRLPVIDHSCYPNGVSS